MLGGLFYKAKSLVRPVTQHRRLLERAKYWGAKILSATEGNDLIAQLLDKPESAAIGKIGGAEIAAMRHCLRHADAKGHCESWSWQATNLYQIAGVYPAEPVIFSRFCATYAKTLQHLDVLGVWFNFGENAARLRFAPKATLTAVRGLEPFYHERPWSRKLAGKRVLVVSPFTETIKIQYRRRQQIWFDEPDLLPDFDLVTLRSPLSAYLITPKYRDWFAALDAMCEEMSSIRFDVALVGAGAWSLSLVAHAKSMGARAIHLGGATQILFGIKGKAWERAGGEIATFFNDAWARPSPAETPERIDEIEGGRYW